MDSGAQKTYFSTETLSSEVFLCLDFLGLILEKKNPGHIESEED